MAKTKIEIEIDSEHLKQLYIAQKEYGFATVGEFIEFYMILGNIKALPFAGIVKRIEVNPKAFGDELKTFVDMYVSYVEERSKNIAEQIKSGNPLKL